MEKEEVKILEKERAQLNKVVPAATVGSDFTTHVQSVRLQVVSKFMHNIRANGLCSVH